MRYEMKQIRRQTAKEAAVFLICRYHFRGLWGKFSLFVLKKQCCGKGARGGGDEHTHSPLLAAQCFLRKQLIKDRG